MGQHAAPEITSAPEILARLDRIAAERHVTGPGLSHAEHSAAALVIADHYTDGGTRKTATGRDRDELFWWYRLGSTWDLIPAYRTARGLAGQGA
ncbi:MULTISPECIES: hypothetical protein [unclassified Streptomyces]|uniref:hypothetical protein n=1 Tax=unclassified Streptomyces TaxID=2593676 RepID=UPI002255E24B|nr:MULTISPECIES: hypothetical protein [unclassified Streptomyces]MCX4405941.1 hypothetical protein [Streptomyces sp. NBC_01764]MCX5189535.1 hypothetical protein [Streptomyces sp. NBC_00268]